MNHQSILHCNKNHFTNSSAAITVYTLTNFSRSAENYDKAVVSARTKSPSSRITIPSMVCLQWKAALYQSTALNARIKEIQILLATGIFVFLWFCCCRTFVRILIIQLLQRADMGFSYTDPMNGSHTIM